MRNDISEFSKLMGTDSNGKAGTDGNGHVRRMDIPVRPTIATAPLPKIASYEVKFRVTEAVARAVEVWAEQNLVIDPHVEPELGNAYRIHSLYLDTPGLDIFRGAKTFRDRKFRVRRYGSEALAYLERKQRTGDRVRKRRTAIAEAELQWLQNPEAAPEWAGGWFHERVLGRQLQPVCQVAYVRSAYVGDGGKRLTIDRHLRCLPAGEWQLEDFDGGIPLLHEECVLELKFRDAMPVLFKQLMAAMSLHPRPFSKYRLSVQAWGLEKQKSEANHA